MSAFIVLNHSYLFEEYPSYDGEELFQGFRRVRAFRRPRAIPLLQLLFLSEHPREMFG